jgi:hypothetical protein
MHKAMVHSKSKFGFWRVQLTPASCKIVWLHLIIGGEGWKIIKQLNVIQFNLIMQNGITIYMHEAVVHG